MLECQLNSLNIVFKVHSYKFQMHVPLKHCQFLRTVTDVAVYYLEHFFMLPSKILLNSHDGFFFLQTTAHTLPSFCADAE